MEGLKLSPVLEAELAFVVKELGPLASICGRCNAWSSHRSQAQAINRKVSGK